MCEWDGFIFEKKVLEPLDFEISRKVFLQSLDLFSFFVALQVIIGRARMTAQISQSLFFARQSTRIQLQLQLLVPLHF